MKHQLFPILAVALMALTAASCSDKLLEPSDLTIAGTWQLMTYRNTEQDKDITYTFNPDHTITIAHAWMQTNPDTTLIMSYNLGEIAPNVITLRGGYDESYEENMWVRLTKDEMSFRFYQPYDPDAPVYLTCPAGLYFVRVK